MNPPEERSMEVHRQRCQSCGSRDMRNVLVRQPNEPQTVFVRCVECGELVARYRGTVLGFGLGRTLIFSVFGSLRVGFATTQLGKGCLDFVLNFLI